MANKTQLYLHIGHPKAGSTTLQSFLFTNWIYLDRRGFAMPTSDFSLSSHQPPPANPLESLQSMLAQKSVEPIRNWIIAAGKTHRKLILSSECLCGWAWHKLFTDLTDLIDIHLIYYVRRQDEILLSAWRQWGLKKGVPLEDFITERLEQKQPDYWSNIAPWRNKTGLKSLYVRFVSAPFLAGGNIQQDLAQHLGLEPAAMEFVENKNISIDARLLLFMSKRPEMFQSVHDDSIFHLLTQANSTEHPLRLSLNAAQFTRIHATFEANNQSFLEKFHPEMAGTPVIDQATANIEESHDQPSIQAQNAYVRACLSAITEPSDPRIEALRSALNDPQAPTQEAD